MQRLRAIIADDEEKICDLIQALGNWDLYNITVIAKCYDGASAWNAILQYHPDIVITDIRMPIYDGLSLIQMAQNAGLNTSFIIISGYRHFEYAHKAIQFGITDYLLKPIDQHELNETLTKLCNRIQARMTSEKTKERFLLLEQENNRQLLSQLSDILWKKDPFPSDVQECNSHFHTNFSYNTWQIFLISFNIPRLLELQPSLPEKAEMIVQKYFSSTCVFHVLPGKKALSVILNYDASESASLPTMFSYLFSGLRSLMDIYGSFDLCVALSSPVASFSLLPAAFEEAVLCEQFKLIKGWNQILNYPKLNSDFSDGILLDSQDIFNLERIINLLSQDKLKNWFETLKQKFTSRNLSPRELFLARDHILLVYNTLGLPSVLTKQLTNQTDCARNVADFINILSQAGCNLILENYETKQSQEIEPIRKAKEYIQKHYQEPLTLEAVAQQVGFNPVYFSTLFKKNTEIGFLDYLTQVRVEQARILLKDSEHSISEIAEMVGYPDPKYFRKIFKKVSGIKPNDFRKLYL